MNIFVTNSIFQGLKNLLKNVEDFNRVFCVRLIIEKEQKTKIFEISPYFPSKISRINILYKGYKDLIRLIL